MATLAPAVHTAVHTADSGSESVTGHTAHCYSVTVCDASPECAAAPSASTCAGGRRAAGECSQPGGAVAVAGGTCAWRGAADRVWPVHACGARLAAHRAGAAEARHLRPQGCAPGAHTQGRQRARTGRLCASATVRLSSAEPVGHCQFGPSLHQLFVNKQLLLLFNLFCPQQSCVAGAANSWRGPGVFAVSEACRRAVAVGFALKARYGASDMLDVVQSLCHFEGG